MPIGQALVFVASVLVFITATQWRAFHPFLALVAVAVIFGYIAGYPVSQLGNVFGGGFSEKIYSPGLVIVTAALIGALADGTGAIRWLTTKIGGWRGPRTNRIAGMIGLIAGTAASPASAFALLMPLLRTEDGSAAPGRDTAATTLALAVSASHGVLLCSPVPIAAAAILGADWGRVALFGVPLAIVLTVVGAVYSKWRTANGKVSAATPPQPAPQGGAAAVLLLAIAAPLVLLVVQSLGDMPSEPLGGGPARELVLGIGRPLILLLASLAIMIAGLPRLAFTRLTDSVWTANVLSKVASTLLIVCAAGGLQRLCQLTGMSEMIGERVLDWHAGAFGLLLSFVVAAVIKTLQGSSQVAAITAAGMVQPGLVALGLDGANAKALAALAIGAGAMTLSHINDEYFWLVAETAGFRPLRGFAAISLGTLLQGAVAAAILLLVGWMIA